MHLPGYDAWKTASPDDDMVDDDLPDCEDCEWNDPKTGSCPFGDCTEETPGGVFKPLFEVKKVSP